MALSLNDGQTPKFIYHKPRQNLYKVLGSCKIKDQATDSWLDGLAYQPVDGGQIYSRPLTAFSDNFEVYYS